MTDILLDVPQVTLADLTTATPSGTGVFDVLMQAVKGHLDQEYLNNRIKGTEYANVYLASMEAAMKNAVDFLLQKDKAALDAALVQKQIELAEVQKQIAEVELQKAQAELPKIAAEIAVLNAQKCKLDAEYDLTLATRDKTAQETLLLTWKVTTEQAQTQGSGFTADSILGRQASLYQAQADGMHRDAEQKATKIMVDAWNIQRTTDSGLIANDTNKLDAPSIGRAVTKLLTGIQA